MTEVPLLISETHATMLIAVGMLIEDARRGGNAGAIRAQVEAIAATLNNPLVDMAVTKALDANLPPDVDMVASQKALPPPTREDLFTDG